jgi:hypothetical protein
MQILDRFKKSLNPVMNPNIKIEEETTCVAMRTRSSARMNSVRRSRPQSPPAQHLRARIARRAAGACTACAGPAAQLGHLRASPRATCAAPLGRPPARQHAAARPPACAAPLRRPPTREHAAARPPARQRTACALTARAWPAPPAHRPVTCAAPRSPSPCCAAPPLRLRGATRVPKRRPCPGKRWSEVRP